MLKFYFSLRSPYSWLAYRDLGTRHRELAGRLEWIPFWEPDEVSLRMLADAGGKFVYTPMSRAKHLYVLQDVRRLATERGLSFAWPVDRAPWWEVPHLGYLVAKRHNRGPEFLEQAYRARWEQGRDVCDRSVVAEIGESVGIDPGEVRDAVENPRVRAEGVEALLSIYRDGVFGVPFFVRGYDRYWGVDRLATFAAAVEGADADAEAAARRTLSAVSAVPGRDDDRATDGGHAGGCG